MDDINVVAKNKKEIKTLMHSVWIFILYIGIAFEMKRCAILIMC